MERTLSSERLVNGHLLKVFRDRVQLQDGSEAWREWIDHPGAAAVLPIDADRNAVLVQQYRYAARRSFLEVPAGRFDSADEAPKAVAARELEEETGLHARTLKPLGALYDCIGYSNEVIHLYLGTDLEVREQNLDQGEFLDVVRVPIAELVRRAEMGELRDMKTTSIVLMARRHLGL